MSAPFSPTHMLHVNCESPIFIGGAAYSFLRPITPLAPGPGGGGGGTFHIQKPIPSIHSLPPSFHPHMPQVAAVVVHEQASSSPVP